MRFCRASAEEIAAVFQTLDTDGDGRVSQNEFLRGIRQLPELAEKLDIDKAVDVGSESRALFGQPSYEIDFDLDKTISVSEFASFFKPLAPTESSQLKSKGTVSLLPLAADTQTSARPTKTPRADNAQVEARFMRFGTHTHAPRTHACIIQTHTDLRAHTDMHTRTYMYMHIRTNIPAFTCTPAGACERA